MNQKQELNLFQQQNRDPYLQSKVYLSPAPYTRQKPDLAIYVQLIGELAQPARKVLQGQGSQVSAYLKGLNPEQMRRPAGQFPPVAALGYAVAEIMLHEPVDERRRREPAVTSWDRHQFLGRR
jgi:hypothetical protein